jgi:hypothetical protein
MRKLTGDDGVLERFYSHVEKKRNGCWNWTAALRRGYGSFSLSFPRKKSVRARQA